MPNLKIFSIYCRSEQYIVSFIFRLQILRGFESGYGPVKANILSVSSSAGNTIFAGLDKLYPPLSIET